MLYIPQPFNLSQRPLVDSPNVPFPGGTLLARTLCARSVPPSLDSADTVGTPSVWRLFGKRVLELDALLRRPDDVLGKLICLP